MSELQRFQILEARKDALFAGFRALSDEMRGLHESARAIEAKIENNLREIHGFRDSDEHVKLTNKAKALRDRRAAKHVQYEHDSSEAQALGALIQRCESYLKDRGIAERAARFQETNQNYQSRNVTPRQGGAWWSK